MPRFFHVHVVGNLRLVSSADCVVFQSATKAAKSSNYVLQHTGFSHQFVDVVICVEIQYCFVRVKVGSSGE